jgi:gluconolactonase
MSNGLANDVNGDLLAAEHSARRVSRTDASAVVTTVVDNYLGDSFNSPNGIAVRSDGTIYFTDPHYGLANPGDREIPFNGLFRVPPGGAAVAEWQGDAVNDGPNGVVLSPDESILYMSNAETGTVEAWDVAADGSLSGMRTFASGMNIPDGMCVDASGNIYVATWASTLEVFSPGGDRWGSIALSGNGTNCTFGGSDRTTLYVTTQGGLYRLQAVIPGVP